MQSTPLLDTKPLTADLELKSDDGAVLRYLDVQFGDREGDVVLMIHGTPVSSRAWTSKTPALTQALLAKGFRVVMMDVRGFGLSTPKVYDSSKCSGLVVVEDHIRLLDKLGVARCHVVGHSMGAEIGLKLTQLHPDRVKSLCLVASGWSDSDNVAVYTEMAAHKICMSEEAHKVMGKPVCGTRCNPFILPLYCWYPCCWPCLCTACLGEVPDVWAAMAASGGIVDILDIPQSDVAAISVPVCGIAGEDDVEKAAVERLVGVLPNYQLTLVPKTDHISVLQDPLFVSTAMEHMLAAPLSAAKPDTMARQ